MRTVFTIGHSTRGIEEFIGLLKTHDITQLVDIRTIPQSRHNPQFGQTQLQASLREAGMKYVYLKKLGGLRSAVKESVNTAWRNKSFRNYADYMQTADFADGMDELMQRARTETSAIMCAEAVPWRCHRSLVGDALLARGVPVCEIIGSGAIRKHGMTSFAVVDGTRITYPQSALKDNEE